jgi:signal transduction histidine kinase
MLDNAARKVHLPALGALLLLALTAEDLRRSFTLLNPGTLLLSLLLAAGLAVREIHRVARGGRATRARLGALLLSLLAVALSSNALILTGRLATVRQDWESEERVHLEERARRLQQEFADLLTDLREPLERARSLAARTPRSGGPRSASRAFEVLDLLSAGRPSRNENLGISLYRSDGRALAWSGPSQPLPHELPVLSIPRDVTKWLVVDDNGLWRLVGLARPWRDSDLLLVVETLIRSGYDQRVLGTWMDPDLFQTERDRIVFISYRLPALDLKALFDRVGDIRVVVAPGLLAVNVALRTGDGALLGHATLRGRNMEERVDRLSSIHQALGNLVVALAGALVVGSLLLPRRRTPDPGTEVWRQALRILSIWTLRVLLLGFPLPAGALRPALDDPGLFSRVDFRGLLGSPLDFLLTAAALLATGILVSLAISRSLSFERPARRGRALAFLVLALLVAFLLGTRLPAEALRVVENTRVEILTVEPLAPQAARLALQTASAFALMGFVIPLVTLLWASVWAIGGRDGAGPPPPPDPTDRTFRWMALLILPCAVLSSFILELALQPAATSVLKRFLENDLTSMVQAIPAHRRMDLRDTLAEIHDDSSLAHRIDAAPREGDPTLAYELWNGTPLAGRKYAVSITVHDISGAPISRFSRSFPPILDAGGLEPVEIAENRIEEFVAGPRGRQIKALHAHTLIRLEGEPVGRVTIHLRNDFGDIPGLSPPTPVEEALGMVRPLSRLLPSWSPRVGLAVYSPQGVPTLASPRDPPPPPPRRERERILSDFKERHWQTRREGGLTRHDLFFSSPDSLVSLSFPEPGFAGRLARAIRYSLQNLAALLILVTPWGIASGLHLGWRPSPSRLVEALTRTHYRRLVASFLVAALVPLFLLALALTNFIRSDIAQAATEHGWTILASLKKEVEAFGAIQEIGGLPDDSYMFSLTRESVEDLSLFRNGVLRATSDAEIYEVGALTRRLDGDVHRRIQLEGRRVVQDRVRIGGRSLHRIHGVVSLGPPDDGVLSILLAAESPEITGRTQQIYDVILITYASVILFMGVVAYVLARRIARPIRHLSQAAARIATGDLRAEVAATTRDETGDLVESFNAMARALRRQRDDLEERGNYIEKILLNATTGVLSVDLQGRIVTINPAAVAILGLEGLRPGEALLQRLSSSQDCAPLAEALHECLETPGLHREAEAEIGTEEEKRNVRGRIVPFTEGAGLLIFLDDVTETVRSNRLATWAEMARRIAHEIKNPLTPMKLSADHIRRVFQDGSTDFPGILEECLATINEQITNLHSIATQFSAYARLPEIRKETTPIRNFLEDVIRPYRVAPPPDTIIERDLAVDLESMEIDRTILSQALVNIIENALQAMPDGGRIAVRAALTGRNLDRALNLEISDTGVGMDKESLARAFEPYFSTKGAGTGLGMAIARRAIEEHMGRIELTSEPGKGTTAKIILPLR